MQWLKGYRSTVSVPIETFSAKHRNVLVALFNGSIGLELFLDNRDWETLINYHQITGDADFKMLRITCITLHKSQMPNFWFTKLVYAFIVIGIPNKRRSRSCAFEEFPSTQSDLMYKYIHKYYVFCCSD